MIGQNYNREIQYILIKLGQKKSLFGLSCIREFKSILHYINASILSVTIHDNIWESLMSCVSTYEYDPGCLKGHK